MGFRGMITQQYKIVANCTALKTDNELLELGKFFIEGDYYIRDKEIDRLSVSLTVFNEDHAIEIAMFLEEKGYH